MSVGEVSSSETKSGSDECDAADFLLANSKYQDCFLIVGNPDTDELEIIGVSSPHLIAHSPVLRKIIEDFRAKDPSESNKIHVTDVSPATFRLILRFAYGGKLPKITAIEAAELALCADKYKISRLVQKALKRLKPSCVDNVFPALICVTSLKCSELELEVEKIVQRETKVIVQNPDFLELDEDCMHFIVRQNTLNVSEAELWSNIVRWAEHQVKINPARTLRDCVAKILQDVRLLTLTSEEILEHVLPTKILTPEEFVALTLAVTKKQPLESPELCKIHEKRKIYRQEVTSKSIGEKTKESKSELFQDKLEIPKLISKSCVFKASDFFQVRGHDNKHFSTLSITPNEVVEIDTFTCNSIHLSPNNVQFQKWYELICNVTITKSMNGVLLSEQTSIVRKTALYNDKIVLPITLKSGQPVVMNPDETWTFHLAFNRPHSIYKLVSVASVVGSIASDKTFCPLKKGNVTFKYEDYFHVVEIAYKTH